MGCSCDATDAAASAQQIIGFDDCFISRRSSSRRIRAAAERLMSLREKVRRKEASNFARNNEKSEAVVLMMEEGGRADIFVDRIPWLFQFLRKDGQSHVVPVASVDTHSNPCRVNS